MFYDCYRCWIFATIYCLSHALSWYFATILVLCLLGNIIIKDSNTLSTFIYQLADVIRLPRNDSNNVYTLSNITYPQLLASLCLDLPLYCRQSLQRSSSKAALHGGCSQVCGRLWCNRSTAVLKTRLSTMGNSLYFESSSPELSSYAHVINRNIQNQAVFNPCTLETEASDKNKLMVHDFLLPPHSSFLLVCTYRAKLSPTIFVVLYYLFYLTVCAYYVQSDLYEIQNIFEGIPIITALNKHCITICIVFTITTFRWSLFYWIPICCDGSTMAKFVGGTLNAV